MEILKFKKPSYDIRIGRQFRVSLVLLGIAVLFSCTKKHAQEISPELPNETETVTVQNVTYINFAKALFETKCNSCHATGRSASARWTFNGYSSVKDHAPRINNVVLVTKTMPIGSSLSAKEIELLDAWFKRNTPEN